MATIKRTTFSEVYKSFLSKITEDMYMQLTPEDTYKILHELLLNAIHKFEFSRKNLSYRLFKTDEINEDGKNIYDWFFINRLTSEEINILSSYMIVEWIGQQLASIENIRMKYSGSDFKFTSQANHIHKLIQLKREYERESFHLQRLYKRRKMNRYGIYKSTMGQIMSVPSSSIDQQAVSQDNMEIYYDSENINYTTRKDLKILEAYIDYIIPYYQIGTELLHINDSKDFSYQQDEDEGDNEYITLEELKVLIEYFQTVRPKLKQETDISVQFDINEDYYIGNDNECISLEELEEFKQTIDSYINVVIDNYLFFNLEEK